MGSEMCIRDSDNTSQDFGQSVTVDSQDNIIVTGWSHDGTTYNYYTVKYDEDFNVLYSTAYDSGGNDIPRGITTDSWGHIIVTGEIKPGADKDFYTIRYSSDLSKVVSKHIYDSGSDDIAYGVATDSKDNIIVTGRSNNDYFTIKYNGPPEISSESTAVSPGRQAETKEVTIKGINFYSGCQVKIKTEEGDISGSVTSVTSEQIKANFTILKSVLLGREDIEVINSDGTSFIKQNGIEIVREKVIDKSNTVSFTAYAQTGEINVDVPAGTFSDNVTIRVSSPTILPPSTVKELTLTNVGVEIEVLEGKPLNKDITITMDYRDTDVMGLNEATLIIAYYDSDSSKWVEIPSTAYPDENKVDCMTRHLSIFAIMEKYVSIKTLDNAFVYPSPYKPGSDTEFDDPRTEPGIVFANLTPQFKLMIFNVAGELVFEHEESKNEEGTYLLDTEGAGGPVASGVYIYVITNPADTSQQARGKFAIIRGKTAE